MAVEVISSGGSITAAVPVVLTITGQPLAGDSVTVSISGTDGTSAETALVLENQDVSSIAQSLQKLLAADSVISSMVEALLSANTVELYLVAGYVGSPSVSIWVTTGSAPMLLQSLYDMGPAQMSARLGENFPAGWASADAMQSGVISELFGALAGQLSELVAQISYVRDAARVPTSTDPELTLAATDFYGSGVLPRPSSDTDAQYAALILGNLFQPAATRSAIENALKTLTGTDPRMIEPWNPGDTGCWPAAASSPWTVNADFAAVPAVPPGATFVRQSRATYIDQSGQLRMAQIGLPRFQPGVGLIVEPQSTNYMTNPMLYGAGAGSLPSNWSVAGVPAGLSIGVDGAFVINNMATCHVAVTGTATASGQSGLIYFDLYQNAPAAVNQQWTLSLWMNTTQSLPSGVQLYLYIAEMSSQGVATASHILPVIAGTAGWSLLTQRLSYTVTTSEQTTAYLQVGLQIYVANPGAYDFGVTIGGLQLEQMAYPTSLILPLGANVGSYAGELAVSNRAGDSLSMPVVMPETGAISMMLEFDPAPGLSSCVLLSATDMTASAEQQFNASLYAWLPGNTNIVWIAPTVLSVLDGQLPASTTRIAVGADVSGGSTAINGVLASHTDQHTLLPNYSLVAIGESWNSAGRSGVIYNQLAGVVRRFAVWPYRRTDAQLVQSTTDGVYPGVDSSFAGTVSFWDTETRANPSRWASPDLVWNGFIEIPLTSVTQLIGNPV